MVHKDRVDTNLASLESETKFMGIKPIVIPADKLEKLKQVMSSHNYGPSEKDMLQKRLSGMCVCCGGIAQHIASYDYNGAVRIERYCDTCVEKQFDRSKKGNGN